MLKKEKKQNETNNKNNNNFENNSYLEYIKIDNKNKLEGFGEEAESNMLMDLVNSISVDKDDNIGKEINNFFIQIIPENKDGDILKVNYALSKKIEENSGLNKKQINKQHEEYMTQIMNSKINQNFILTSDINEKLSFVLSIIFKKIKKINKINKYEDLEKYIKDISQNLTGILEKYKDKNKNNNLASSYVYIENSSNIYNDYNNDLLNQSTNINLFSNINSLSTSISRISKAISNNNEFNKNVYMDNNLNTMYIFRELKTKKQLYIPLEVLVLREKFEKIKKLKLILKKNNPNNDNNDILLLDQKDILNNVFILLNLKWLFPYLFEIELDITNENILKDIILSNNDKYEKFLKKSKKYAKITNYKNNYTKRIYDLNKKSIFNEQNKNNNNNIVDEFELSESYSIISSVKDNKEEEIKKEEYFIKKYMSSLEMLIIYWYFFSKIDTIKNI